MWRGCYKDVAPRALWNATCRLRSTPESMVTPSWVKTYGKHFIFSPFQDSNWNLEASCLIFSELRTMKSVAVWDWLGSHGLG